jgi:hypothetical protein
MNISDHARAILEMADNSLTWGDLNDDERTRFTKIANLAARILDVQHREHPEPITPSVAVNM